MGRLRGVTADTVRLPLSEGDYVDVTKELNAGEYFDLVKDGAAGNAFPVLVAYLVGWSLLDLDGQPIPYSVQQSQDDRRATLRRELDVATLVELVAAVEAHHAALERAIQEKKTTQEPVLA
jgi:hypothetical protein